MLTKNKGTNCYFHVEVMSERLLLKGVLGIHERERQNDRITLICLQTQFLLPLVLVNIKYV